MARDERETRRLIGGTIFMAVCMFLAGLIVIGFSGCGAGKALKPSLIGVNPDGDANAVKLQGEEINAVKSDMSKMLKMFEEIKLNAEVKAVDVSKRSETTAGGDIVNDSGLMGAIFKYWYGIFLLIIGFMKWNSIQIAKQYEKQIKQLTITKEDYKKRYLTIGIKNEEELAKFRAEHDALKGRAK